MALKIPEKFQGHNLMESYLSNAESSKDAMRRI